jgi:hypothetical protein
MMPSIANEYNIRHDKLYSQSCPNYSTAPSASHCEVVPCLFCPSSKKGKSDDKWYYDSDPSECCASELSVLLFRLVSILFVKLVAEFAMILNEIYVWNL